MLRASCLALLSLQTVACGGETTVVPASADAAVDAPLLSDAGACGVTTGRFNPDPALHVDQGSTLTFASNPPCGGNHYPFWAMWGVHDTPIPRGNWIHNLEHGGVVFLYRCASRAACPALAAKVEALVATLPQDPVCSTETPAIKNRAIVTPDPDLPAGVEVAIAGWGGNLIARCVDDKLFRDFYTAHAGRAPENFCSQGSVVVPPADAGAVEDTAKGK